MCPYRIVLLHINFLTEALYPFIFTAGLWACVCVCLRVCLSNRPEIFLRTCGAQWLNWACSDVVNRSVSTVLQVPAFHSPLCSCPSVFSVTSLILHLSGNFYPPKTNIILFSHPLTYSEEQHQHLVFSPCFSERTALILLDKGWESQENISACAHMHICKHTEMSCATICLDGHRAAKYTSFIEYVEYVKHILCIKVTVSDILSEQAKEMRGEGRLWFFSITFSSGI